MMAQEKTRRRDSEATAAAIVAAAAELFSQRGYDGASTREIADRAGVNVALISRYFGSKEGLFEASILPMLSINRLLSHDMATFGTRIAGYYFDALPEKTADPILAVIRSSGNEAVRAKVRDRLRERFVNAIAEKLDGADAKTRAVMIVMVLSGVDLMVRVLGVVPEHDSERAALKERLAEDIQKLVNG
ncbi:TetR family transcriptional regulator [Pelagovum sp. HNIBRBA483]|uniref:TetR family transcriptional regulator n=1 Tax=Pelagovum sp. HNIBRBA483 TaxID=3233341 RepID=UPI0034A594A5